MALNQYSSSEDTRDVFFFDIDNCLYSQDLGVEELLSDLIDEYIMTKLDLSMDQARALHAKYYKEYGLTVIGLQRHHQIDPLEFNREVDERLPMKKLLSRSRELTRFFASFDRSKVKLWLLTNAHILHGLRVVGLLGIAHFFEGITYCNYGDCIESWTCKPSCDMYQKAEREAAVAPTTRCCFVDDSAMNCEAAAERGWQVLWIQNSIQRHALPSTSPASNQKRRFARIENLLQIRDNFPELFTDEGLFEYSLHHGRRACEHAVSILPNTLYVGA